MAQRLHTDALLSIFEAFVYNDQVIYADNVLRDVEFYRAMGAVGLDVPVSRARKHLATCGLVCKSWREPAQRLLLHNIHIKNRNQCDIFISQLVHHPEAGHAIRSLHLLGESPDSKHTTIKKNQVLAVISRCPNLTSLRVDGAHFVGSPEVLSYCRRLTALDLGRRTIIDRNTLKHLLDGAPQLQVLALQDIAPYCNSAPIPSPNLRLQAFLPYRLDISQYQWLLATSVTSLRAYNFNVTGYHRSGLNDGSLRDFLRATSSLETVSMNVVTCLPSIASWCPSLTHLRIPTEGLEADSFNRVIDKGFKALRRPLSSLTIYLSGEETTITSEYLKLLAARLLDTPALSRLRMLTLESKYNKPCYETTSLPHLDKLSRLCNAKGITFQSLDPSSHTLFTTVEDFQGGGSSGRRGIYSGA